MATPFAPRDPTRYDIYDDTRDQVYGGLDYGSGEDPGSTAAVQATAREVPKSQRQRHQRVLLLLERWEDGSLGGHLGRFRFRTSSRGRIPFDRNGSNPNRNWTVVLSPRALQNRLGAAEDSCGCDRHIEEIWARRPCPPRARLLGSAPSRRPGLGPEWFRGVLGLRSSRFDFGVLDATPAKAKIVCSARLRVSLPGEGGIGRHAPAPAKRLVVLDRHVAEEGLTQPITTGSTGRAARPPTGSTRRLRTPLRSP